jgi:hypothetical protein
MATVGRPAEALGLALALLAASALPAQTQPVPGRFRTRLTTAPFQDQINRGDGEATATLLGHSLRLAGHFDGLVSAAFRIRLLSGRAVGVRGDRVIRDLPVRGGGTAGEISATVRLTASQSALLEARRLYVEVDTAAAPDGALIGWLMPDHRFAGERVPEKQNWAAQ